MINEGTHKGAGPAYAIKHSWAGYWGSKDWTPCLARARVYDRQIGQLALDIYEHRDDRPNLSLVPVELDSEGNCTTE